MEKRVSLREKLFTRISRQIKQGSVSGVQAILREYSVVPSDIYDDRHRTLLHISAMYNRSKITRFLMANGCSIHAQDSSGKCPYYIALLYKSTRVLEEMETMK
ncbi:hypothetical protein NEOKW01_0806 [Nematocida sp. AWRm80]|nr:hypothetical protein NEOKW01_0806 [Nematocida sp. AWRm80]